MPDTVPGVTFRDGVCNFCLEYEDEQYLGKEALDHIIREACDGNTGSYDCIVPMSGGRDSTYVLYVARVIYGLRVLAVSYDNEFRTDQALVNMRRACDTLRVKLLSVCSRRNIARRMVRSQIRLSLSVASPVVDGLCIACARGYRSVVYRLAEQHGIPLIFWGESQAESTSRMMQVVEKARPQRRRTTLAGLARRLRPAYWAAEYLQLLQRLEFHVPKNRRLSTSPPRLRNRAIREVRVFDYLPWDRTKIKNTVSSELGWEKPADSSSSWRIDCSLVPLVNHEYLKQYGCSKACFGYCNMINAGHMTRDEALRQEEATLAAYAATLPALLKDMIGLSSDEVERICRMDSRQPLAISAHEGS